MQLTDTQTSDNADGTTTVTFFGEGGEFVAVRMVASGLGSDVSITRARQVMVQLTAFDDASDPVDPARDGDRPASDDSIQAGA